MFVDRHFVSIIAMVMMTMMIQSSSAAKPKTITFRPANDNFLNPERGFFMQNTPMWMDDERQPQSVEYLQSLRKKGYSLVRWYFLIDEFRESAISNDALEYINTQLGNVRLAGLKVIPRFAYNFPTGGEFPYQDPDAPLSRVLSHLDQLGPILQANSDVVAFMETGFVGAWGEWHSSTNNLVDLETGINDASRAIIDKLMTVLPQSLSIAMRYPPYKRVLYGDDPLTAEEAFSGSPKSRMGAHNDCFLASKTDYGTYPEDAKEREELKKFLSADNRYLAQGGETCNADKHARPFIQCKNALKELRRMRWSTLNIDYHQGVIALWRKQKCFGKISQLLGYRFRFLKLRFNPKMSLNQNLIFALTLKNLGFASPYNRRGLEIILRNVQTKAEYRMDIKEKNDPRRWFPDRGTITLHINETLPGEITPGNYLLLLNLPDLNEQLYNRSEFSIRFANKGVWEATSGFNKLTTIQIQ